MNDVARPEAGKLAPVAAGGAPGFLFWLYVGGLVLVYVGERVLSGLPRGAGFFSALGVVAVLTATAFRFAPKYRSGGERRSIERLLTALSVLGLLGLAVYYVTTDRGAERFGLAALASEKREHVLSLLRVIWTSLITLSVVPQLFAEAALTTMRRAERPESRRVRAAAAAGGALALAAVYGSLLVYAGTGIEKKFDYSYFKTSRPGESTLKIAASLAEPLRVVAFFPDVNEVKVEVERYLRELAASSPKLKIEVQDRLLAPKLAKELRASQDGVIVLAKGSTTYLLNIGTEMEAARPKLKTLDRDFQEQLLKAVRAKKTVYLTVGHGELNDGNGGKDAANGRTAEVAKLLLQKQNVVVKELGLAQGLGNEVPDDADAVLVLGPSEGFSPEEIATLGRFAARGGHLLLALDPEAHSTLNLVGAGEPGGSDPGPDAPAASSTTNTSPKAEPAPAKPPGFLTALAALAGLSFSPELLANERQHVRVRNNDSDRTRLISSSFSSHASVSTLSRNAPRATVVVFGSGSLDKLPGATGKVDFVVRSLSGTFSDKNGDFKLDPGEKPAVYNLAAAVSRPIAGEVTAPVNDKAKADKSKANEAKEMRAFVLADVDAFSDVVMSNVIGNQIWFVDAMRWLVGEESYSGQVNNEEDVRIEHTKQQDLAWFYATIFGIPSLVLGAGVWTLKRSRRSRGGAA